MRFLWTTLNVSSLVESLAFYESIVELKLQRRFQAGPGMEIAFLGNGETQLELIADEKRKAVKATEDISLGFQVESLEAMLKKVADHRINLHSGPFQPNPGIKFFFIQDPDGFLVQFVEIVE